MIASHLRERQSRLDKELVIRKVFRCPAKRKKEAPTDTHTHKKAGYLMD